MSLIYGNKNKLDNRTIEYGQSVVRLGLEKSKAQNDTVDLRREINNLKIRRDLLVQDIKDNENKLLVEEEKLDHIRQDVIVAVENSAAELNKIQSGEKEKEGKIQDKEIGLKKLENYLLSLTNQLKDSNAKCLRYQQRNRAALKILMITREKLNSTKRELEKISDSLKSIYKLRVELTGEVTALDIERIELEDIIKNLKINNKEGLELVASFEGERKRLVEKEKILDQTRYDLLKYIKRFQIEREKAGIKTVMLLPVIP